MPKNAILCQDKPHTCILLYKHRMIKDVYIDIVYIVSASCQKSIQYSSYTLEFIPCNWFHTIQVKID